MTKLALKSLIKNIKIGKDKELIVRLHKNSFKKNLNDSFSLEELERMIRIQRLEIQLKKMRIHRSLN